MPLLTAAATYISRCCNNCYTTKRYTRAGFCRTEQYEQAIDMFIGVEVLETELQAASSVQPNTNTSSSNNAVAMKRSKSSRPPPKKSRDREQRIGWPVYNEVHTQVLVVCDTFYADCFMPMFA
jgi:hypothetical protein